MTDKTRFDVSEIKTKIYRRLSGCDCPACGAEGCCVGGASQLEETPGVYCIKCGLRTAIPIVVTKMPKGWETRK